MSEVMIQPWSSNGVILCGAGVSAAGPAHLPTVRAFLDELEAVCRAQSGLSDTEIRQALHGNSTNAAPRFEQVVTILLEFDPALTCLSYLRIDPITGDHRPNALHRYLAHHIHDGGTVVTTNFDALIELAYLSLYCADIVSASGTLLKIHGSIQTTDNGTLVAADPRTIKADIFSVAAGTPISGAGGTLAELTDRLEGQDILVLGYSFSDSFDVTPALTNATPRSATVVEYAPDSLDDATALTGLPYFAEISQVWRTRNVALRLLRGDPISLVPTHLQPRPTEATASVAPARTLLPPYNADQLRYLVARLLQSQDAFMTANPLFQTLSREAHDPDIKTRAMFFFVRTLPDWDEMVPFEAALTNLAASADIRLRAYILLLDLRAFIGPGSAFLAHFAKLKRLLADDVFLERDRVLNLGKAHHCFANYLMNRGRPRWALRFAEASLSERTRFGEPSDIFNAEFGCCLALALLGELVPSEKRLENLRRYARSIDDQTSAVCLAFVEGLYLLESSQIRKGLRRLEQARNLYTTDGQDTQVDPELDLYILEARVRLSGWTHHALQELDAVTRYVHGHRYTYFIPVVAALQAASSCQPLPARCDRLTRAHLRHAGLLPSAIGSAP